MMQRWVLCFAAWLSVASSAGASRGDVFILVGGGRIEGELLNPDESPRRSYRVRTAAGGVITLAESQVERVLRDSDAERWYERWLPKMPNTAEGNWIMAQECGQRGLDRQRQFHLQEVLKLDPEHAAARRALGYGKVGNRWVKEEGLGLVRHGGTWKLRQEIELDAAAEEQEKEENEWRRQLKIWRGWIVRGRGEEQKAVENIRSIRSPNAAPALADMLEEAKEQPGLKLLYIEVLGKLHSSRATTAFVSRVLLDANENVRDRCLEQLAAWDTERAVAALAAALQHKDNRMVNRAGAALGRLKHPDAIRPLIDALTTKHRFQVNTGGGMNATFTPKGGGGMTMGGGGPKIIEVEKRNPDVHAALVAIASGANYGYDKEAWKRWYAEQHTPTVVDLRRRH